MSTLHSKAATAFLANAKKVTWHDETFWSLRAKRDTMAHETGEWEQLRDAASAIKKHTLTHLDKYLEQFAGNAEKTGAPSTGPRMPESSTPSCSAYCATTA